MIDLLPGGKNVTVTRKNRQLYVDLYIHYLLNEKVSKQFDSFAFGFSKVFDFYLIHKQVYFLYSVYYCSSVTRLQGSIFNTLFVLFLSILFMQRVSMRRFNMR